MYGYLVRRILLIFPTVLFAGTLCFFLLRVMPGDIVTTLNSEGGASIEAMERLRSDLGLNDPLLVQYGRWLWGAIQGDLGYSHLRDRNVSEFVVDRLETTLTMAVFAMTLSLLIAIPTGIISAIKRGSLTDQFIRIITAICLAMPPFWVGIMIVLVTSIYFNWVPPLIYKPFFEDPFTNIRQMMFPVLAAGLASSAVISRLMRSMMLEVLYQDYIRTARSKGLLERNVIIRHAMKNALVPVLTMCGFHFSAILGGVVVIETVFNLPGMGRQLLVSALTRDTDMVLGIVLALTVILSVWILIIDLVYAFVDPRIRYQ